VRPAAAEYDDDDNDDGLAATNRAALGSLTPGCGPIAAPDLAARPADIGVDGRGGTGGGTRSCTLAGTRGAGETGWLSELEREIGERTSEPPVALIDSRERCWDC